jgi:hypothetical protein
MAEISTRQHRDSSESKLRAAFEQTDYLTLDRGRVYCIRPGRPTPLVLTRKCRGRSWAIVTADNPGASRASGLDNRAAGRRLHRMLTRMRPLVLLSTLHNDRSGIWPDEQGWLICPVAPALAMRIGRSFGQLAVVVGGPRRRAEIADCSGRSRHNAGGHRFHPDRRFAS